MITAAISPYREIRDEARQMMGDRFVEAYVKASVETCERARRQGPLRQGPLRRDQGVHRRLGSLRAAGEPRAGARDRAAVAGGVGGADPRLPRGARADPGRRRRPERNSSSPCPLRTRALHPHLPLRHGASARRSRRGGDGCRSRASRRCRARGPCCSPATTTARWTRSQSASRRASTARSARWRRRASGTSAASARSSTGWVRSRSCAARATPAPSIARSRRCSDGRLHRRLPRGHALARTDDARPRRDRAPRRGGPRDEDRLRHGRRHHRLRASSRSDHG